MAIFQETQITEKGHRLLTKVLSNVCDLTFTKIQGGDGSFDYNKQDVFKLTKLVSPRHNGRVVSVKPMGKYTEVECLLTNQTLVSFMAFRELGLFAKDPNEGEVLFAYTNAGEYADPIGAYNGLWVHEEHFTVKVYTANAANIAATLSPTGFAHEILYKNEQSGLSAETVQDALDILAVPYHLGVTFTHNLSTYPTVTVFEVIYGSGMGGCGETPCGGESEVTELKSKVTYLDGKRAKIALSKKYSGTPKVTKITDSIFSVVFSDVALRVGFTADYAAMVTKLNTLNTNLMALVSALSSRVDNNKQAADKGIAAITENISALFASGTGTASTLTALSKTVTDNKKLVDTDVKRLDTKIDAVPTGSGN